VNGYVISAFGRNFGGRLELGSETTSIDAELLDLRLERLDENWTDWYAA